MPLWAAEGESAPDDVGERTAWTFAQRGILELTHNWGTESDADFKYHDGNAQPQGFGHICFSVPDLDAAVKVTHVPTGLSVTCVSLSPVDEAA
jgi:lactoylglutathione lyase